MSEWQLKTPVAFIIFNRPDTTERVFAEIAKAKPPKLLVIADGHRPTRAGEAEKCASSRAIIDQVDWPCEVLTNYSDVNLGCKNRVATGIDWVFEQVPEAIILEDDCLPDPSFFRFCEELLETYRDDERIAMISGDNFQFGVERGDGSYYFSRYMHIWGWATWRRAWRYYDRNASIWPIYRGSGYLKCNVSGEAEYKYWYKSFQAVYDGEIDTWDYQWTMAVWAQGMLSVMPNVNLVSNIGFGVDATHTVDESILANMSVEKMDFPLRHPVVRQANCEADSYTANLFFSEPGFWGKLTYKARRLFGRIFENSNKHASC